MTIFCIYVFLKFIYLKVCCMHMFLGSYSMHVLGQLIKTMTNLLMSSEREIVKSALGFFKVCPVIVSTDSACSRF